MWALQAAVGAFDPEYQHGAHTPLCGHAHWSSSPTAQIDFIAADRE